MERKRTKNLANSECFREQAAWRAEIRHGESALRWIGGQPYADYLDDLCDSLVICCPDPAATRARNGECLASEEELRRLALVMLKP